MIPNNPNIQSFEKSVTTNPLMNISAMVTYFLWGLFICNLAYVLYFYPDIPKVQGGIWFRFNGFTLLVWTMVTFFGALVCSYAKNYLLGFAFYNKFMLLSLGFTLSVMCFVASNHIVLMLLGWLSMGLFMSRLIGVDSTWGEAHEASKFTQRYFLLGTVFLSFGVLLLSYASDSLTVTGIISSVDGLPSNMLLIAALCIILSALVQSAIYPFHRWLLSAMTAPTPASALMHAGFVNGSGILLAIFSTVLFASHTQDILLVVGGLTAIIAQFTKLLQVNLKQKLACSTIAQLGFMIMQCDLGFFNAALVHLILHGFYKAYLFLSSGEEIAHSNPQGLPQIKINFPQAVAVLFFGIIGALLFSFLTGKGANLDSGIFLTLIVAITVGQLTYNIIKQQSLSLSQKIVLPPILFISGIFLYAILYNTVTVLMGTMPMVLAPSTLSVVQIVFGVVFLTGFFVMKLGIYQKAPWLYIKLMNLSQPYKKSVLMYKSKI